MATYNETIRYCCECENAVREIGMDVFCLIRSRKVGMFRRCETCRWFETNEKQDYDFVNGQYICR